MLGIPDSRPASDIPIHHVASSSVCLSSATTTTVYSTINISKCSTKTEDTSVKIDSNSSSCIQEDNCENIDQKPDTNDIVKPQDDVRENHPEVTVVSCNNVPRSIQETNLKRKNDDSTCDGEPPSKQPKQNILNHSLPLLNLSNNHPLKKHSKMNRNGENVKKNSPKVIILENDIIVPSCSVSSVFKVDVATSKPVILNKTMPIMQSTKPSTTVSLSKSIMSTKASIIPPKLPTATYAGQKAPCYMPKTTFVPVLNVPKPVTVNSR